MYSISPASTLCFFSFHLSLIPSHSLRLVLLFLPSLPPNLRFLLSLSLSLSCPRIAFNPSLPSSVLPRFLPPNLIPSLQSNLSLFYSHLPHCFALFSSPCFPSLLSRLFYPSFLSLSLSLPPPPPLSGEQFGLSLPNSLYFPSHQAHSLRSNLRLWSQAQSEASTSRMQVCRFVAYIVQDEPFRDTATFILLMLFP